MLSLYFNTIGWPIQKKKNALPGMEPRRFNCPGSSPMELKVNFSEILSYDASALLTVQFPKF